MTAPHVVANPERWVEDVYTKMGPETWVLDHRITPTQWEMLSKELQVHFEPVYIGKKVPGSEHFDYAGAPGDPIVIASYWLRPDLIPHSERIRYPMMAAKCNFTEGLNLGALRELYSWDGWGFKLRNPLWGRE